MAIDFREAAFCSLVQRYQLQAKYRNLEFSLTDEELKFLFKGNCHYCGIKPKQIHRPKFRMPFIYNGIDRINNSLGYITGNCVSCCQSCNSAKGTKSMEEFIQWNKDYPRHMPP